MRDHLKKVLVIFGTRPEAIKLLPIVNELKKHQDTILTEVCVTAQHRQMLDQVLNLFEVKPDYDLNLMEPNQSLGSLTSKILQEIEPILAAARPDYLLVQGDTTTTFASSLIGFYHKIPVLHVEAGLRTNNIYSPFPEEVNRRITSTISTIHFAPTDLAKQNLLKENINSERILVTGNTTIDALYYTLGKLDGKAIKIPGLISQVAESKFILVTGHRRENFGSGFLNICSAIKQLADTYADYQFVYPVHLNPNVRKPVFEILADTKNIHLIEPLTYIEFVYLMQRAYFIMTDSGGIQEEAPAIGKPIIILRDTTERPEVLIEGAAILCGTSHDKIINAAQLLLDKPEEYARYAKVRYIFGNGKASSIIVNKIREL